jgi:hypothetical protein
VRRVEIEGRSRPRRPNNISLITLRSSLTTAREAISTSTLVAQIGKLPPTPSFTTAQRWYDQPVIGAVRNPTNND